MERIRSTVSELFQTEKTPSEIFNILKPRVRRPGVNKILKCLREIGSALPKVRTTPNKKTRTPSLIKNTGEEITRNQREA